MKNSVLLLSLIFIVPIWATGKRKKPETTEKKILGENDAKKRKTRRDEIALQYYMYKHGYVSNCLAPYPDQDA